LSKYPGGLTEYDFLITFAERTKKHLRKTNFDKQEIKWIDVIYKHLDIYIEEEDYNKIRNDRKRYIK